MPTNPLFYNQFKFLTVEDESYNVPEGTMIKGVAGVHAPAFVER